MQVKGIFLCEKIENLKRVPKDTLICKIDLISVKLFDKSGAIADFRRSANA